MMVAGDQALRDSARLILQQGMRLQAQVRDDLTRQNFLNDTARYKAYNDLAMTAVAVFPYDPILTTLELMPDSVTQYYHGIPQIYSMPPELPTQRVDGHLQRLLNRLELLVGVPTPIDVVKPIGASRSTEGVWPQDRAAGRATHDYDVALSFAGSERELAQTLAMRIRTAGYQVFYDAYYPEKLWGKDLAVFFDAIFRTKSRYAVIFASAEYAARMWTNHERKSAVARSVAERGSEYILPIKVDGTELAGVAPTVGYLSLEEYTIEGIADLLVAKLAEGSG